MRPNRSLLLFIALALPAPLVGQAGTPPRDTARDTARAPGARPANPADTARTARGDTARAASADTGRTASNSGAAGPVNVGSSAQATAVDCEEVAERAAKGRNVVLDQPAAISLWSRPLGAPAADTRGRTVEARFTVSPYGDPDWSTLQIEGTEDADYRDRIRRALELMRFRPARIGECGVAAPLTVRFPG